MVQESAIKFSYTLKNENISQIFSYISRGNLNPMHASIGGIVAHEVLKAASQQFTPICQWYLNDCLECLATNCLDTVDSDIYQSTGSRYDGQVAVFGSKFQEKLENLRYFVVGAGAIGSELLKNFAMIGTGAGRSGTLYVTDMDFIERSNLSRQFLFRDWHIGQSKSLTATAAVAKMNPGTRVIAHCNQVGADTESVYLNSFFLSLDCVVNALDNVEARQYVATRIEFNGCPMIDSGTLGLQASQQVVIPGLTNNYRATMNPHTAIPSCTLKNFPYQIEHTIQWAKDLFTSHFCNTPRLAEMLIKDRAEFFRKIEQMTPYDKFNTVNQVFDFIVAIPKSFEDCIEWALNEWFSVFSKAIQQVLHSFPADAKTLEGLPFWSGTKRVPRFEEFDTLKNHQMDFVIATSKLRARLFRIKLGTDEQIKSFASSFQFESFSPSSDVKIAVDDSELDKVVDLGLMGKIIKDLRRIYIDEELQIDPQQFDSNDDSNFHIDFITAASNMRAHNYRIEQADRLKTKRIAGNIPALATTTSVIAGQVCLELYKLAQGHTDVRKYRDSFLNLASPVFTMTIPERATRYSVLDRSYTLWDKIDIQGDMTLKDFLDLMRYEYGMENICCLSYKNVELFAIWLDQPYLGHNHEMLLNDLIRIRVGHLIFDKETVIPINIWAEEDNGEEIERVPVVRLHLSRE